MPLSQNNLPRPPCSRKLCKNLFGPVDHEQFKKDFESLMREDLEAARRKWNFDFETGTPLEGHYKWEKISHRNVVPPQDLLHHPKENDCAGENGLSSPLLLKTDSPMQVDLDACNSGSSGCLKRKQTSIKDFYTSKRRTIPCKSNQ